MGDKPKTSPSGGIPLPHAVQSDRRLRSGHDKLADPGRRRVRTRKPVELYVLNADAKAMKDVFSMTVSAVERFVKSRNDNFNFRDDICNLVIPGHVPQPVREKFEDIANARLRFANGAVATITAIRVSIRTERRMRIFARDTYLAADFSSRKLTVIGRGIGQPVPGVAGIGIEEASWDDHDSLAAEHAAFYDSVLNGTPVLVGAEAGRRALAAALGTERSAAE